MSFLRRALSTRAARVHSVLFGLGFVGFPILDWLQGTDSETTTLGLDWAHVIVVLWVPLFVFHVVITWWGGEVADLDKGTMRRLQMNWFGHYKDE